MEIVSSLLLRFLIIKKTTIPKYGGLRLWIENNLIGEFLEHNFDYWSACLIGFESVIKKRFSTETNYFTNKSDSEIFDIIYKSIVNHEPKWWNCNFSIGEFDDDFTVFFFFNYGKIHFVWKLKRNEELYDNIDAEKVYGGAVDWDYLIEVKKHFENFLDGSGGSVSD